MKYNQFKNEFCSGCISIYNGDCMDLLRQTPNKYYDLCIVDPPYGIGISSNPVRQLHSKKNWDNSIPKKEYFDELFRVSKNQIIWGGNYFPSLWEFGCKGFIFWYKQNPVDNFSDGELAWTSFNKPAYCFPFRYYGGLQGNTSAECKIHPTQKPIELYDWLLMKYAKEGDKILDTHLGSGSIAIACHDLHFDLVACEIDKEYYDKALEKYEIRKSQLKLF